MDLFAACDERHGICLRRRGEDALGKKLPCIFFEKSKYIPPIVGTLSAMPVNKYVLGLQDPVTSANKKHLSYLCAISELIGSITELSAFSTTDRLLALREERQGVQKIRDDTNDAKQKGTSL